MFRKYEKTFHVFPVTSKYNLDNTTIQRLLAGEVIVEEKLDGANIGIIRHKKGISLQKRNSLVGQSEHEQFGFFHNWANYQNYEKLMAIPDNNITIYGELLYAVHTIVYDSLPDYVLVFDVRVNGDWLDYDERKEFCEKYNLHMVPLIARGSFTKNQLLDLIPEKSAFGPSVEGIVVKRYARNGYFKGKIVRSEFIKTVEESDHWTEYNIRKNTLARV